MFFSGIKDFILNKKIESKLNNPARQSIVSGTIISTALVVVRSKEEGKRFTKLFNDKFSDVEIDLEMLVFKDEKHADENSFDNKDVNIFGAIKNDKLVKVIETEHDLLIHFGVDNLFLNYLSILSKAKFKVGNSNSKLNMFNLMISVEENNMSVFITELKKYLKILNKI